MKIGEVATKAGISIRMLRWYEEQGLILPERSRSGYREYDNGHLRILIVVKRLQLAGLSIAKIIELMPCIIEQHMTITQCPKVMATLNDAKNKLRQNIKQLQLSEASLDEVIRTIGNPIKNEDLNVIANGIKYHRRANRGNLSFSHLLDNNNTGTEAKNSTN